MRIVHFVNVSSKYSNGIKTVLLNLIPHQKAQGHYVVVFNLYKNSVPAFEDEFYISGYKTFVKCVQYTNPDLVVFHGGYEWKYYICAHYLRVKNISYIVEPHGGTSRYNLQKRRLLKSVVNCVLTNYFIQKSKGIIFLNDNERSNSVFHDKVRKYGIIPNGVSLQQFDYSHKMTCSKIRFIYLSRIDIKYKGLDILLQAIEKFFNSCPEFLFEFHFYGGRYDPTIVETFRQMVEQTNAPVFYHGEVLGDEKDMAYKDANIYVLTSLSEGMPLTVLEALSYGCPCVVTPQTNMDDLISKKQAGWVTCADVECINDALRHAYLEYTNERERYIVNAFNAAKEFSWDSIAKKSIQVYSKLIKK